MKGLVLIEWLIILAIAGILIALIVGTVSNRSTFKQVCDEAHGTTVFDGRQYQCIKP